MLDRLPPTLALIAFAAITGWAAARLVRRFWPKSGDWGINATRPVCPHCQTPAPRVRKPANRRQLLWGGWTCPHCGLEIDKYGKPTGTGTPNP